MPYPPPSNTDREPTNDEVKEVYAEFGAAYYFSEVLHRGLSNFLALSRVPEIGGMTRPRVEEFLVEAFSSTLGGLLTRLEHVLPESTALHLRTALESRNFLAHHFWFERAPLLLTAEGTRSCIAELRIYRSQFEEADAEIDAVMRPLRLRLGITDELLAELYAGELRGEAMEAISTRRKVKKEETIVAIYDVPTSDGAQTLIFEAEDGVLFQLCEAGLGWSLYDERMPEWRTSQRFEGLLPARVKTRPPIASPWRYEMPIGHSVSLVVQYVAEKGCYGYRLKKGT